MARKRPPTALEITTDGMKAAFPLDKVVWMEIEGSRVAIRFLGGHVVDMENVDPALASEIYDDWTRFLGLRSA